MPKSAKKIVVIKFGGTSVMDTSSVTNVINIVRKNPAQKVVVVSAISKATNALEQMAHYASQNRVKEAELLLEEIINRHHVIINNLVSDKKLKSQAVEKIIDYHRKIA